MFVGRVVYRVQPLASGQERIAKGSRLAAGSRVGDEDMVGERADHPVASFGQGSGNALVLWRERGQDQEPTGIEGGKPPAACKICA